MLKAKILSVLNESIKIPFTTISLYHNAIPLSTYQDVYNTKRQAVKSIGEGVEKLEPSCIIGRNVKWGSHCGNQFGIVSNVKQLPYVSPVYQF